VVIDWTIGPRADDHDNVQFRLARC
jgi:hypothetical protein